MYSRIGRKKIFIGLLASCLSSMLCQGYASELSLGSGGTSAWSLVKSLGHHRGSTLQADSSDQLALTPVDSTGQDASQDTTYKREELFPPATPAQQQVFSTITRSAMPMTPDEIARLKNMLAITRQAAAAPAGTPPKPVLSTQVVSLEPGSSPPVIRLEEGFVTTVLFMDNTGTSWPIQSYDLGDSRAFNIQWQSGSNMLMIQAMSAYTTANLAITLEGLSTPVMLTLIPGQQVVDYRADLRVNTRKPMTESEELQSMVSSKEASNSMINDTLLSVLNGISPQNAEKLKVDGGDGEAWLVGDKMYLRTKLTVLSPAWISVMKNIDGTIAYEMEKSSTVLVSMYGKPTKLKIEGL